MGLEVSLAIAHAVWLGARGDWESSRGAAWRSLGVLEGLTL